MTSLLIHTEIWIPSVIIFCAVFLVLFRQLDFGLQFPANANIMALGISLLVGSIFLATLLGFWLTGKSHPNAIGGLIPWNDAAGYYSCAISVLEGGRLSDFCGRRPMYALYVSMLSWFSGTNLQLTLILQASITAGAIALFLRQLLFSLGTIACAIAAVILIAFSSSFATAILTENIGFVLGLIGLLLLLSGVARHNKFYLFLGAFLLSLGLNARAGAFFILLTMCFWPWLSKRQMGQGKTMLSVSLFSGALLGFFPGLIFVYLLGSHSAVIHSNFSAILYGLAAGGESWAFIHSQFPEASTGEIYAAAFELIRGNPLLFGRGIFQGVLEYLQRIFSYINWLPARVPISLFWMWGMAGLISARKNDVCLMLILLYAGVLVSAPILSIAGDTRFFATTIGLDAIMASYGFYSLSRLLAQDSKGWFLVLLGGCILVLPNLLFYDDPRAWGVTIVTGLVLVFVSQFLMDLGSRDGPEWRVVAGSAPLLFAIVVVGLVSVPAIASTVYVMRPAPEGRPAGCEDGQLSVNADLGKTSPVLSLVSGNKTTLWPLAAEIGSFREHISPLVAHHKELEKVSQGYSLSLIIDDSSPGKGPRFVYWDHARYGILQGRHTLCLDYKISDLKADIARLAKATVIE